jgi:hypothetical protein
MDETDFELRNLDNLQSVALAYWSALLAVNAVVVTVFSALALFSEQSLPLILPLIGLGVLSSVLLLFNFRNAYKIHSDMVNMRALSPEEMRRQMERSQRVGPGNWKRTEYALFLLVLQFIVLLILFTVKLCSESKTSPHQVVADEMLSKSNLAFRELPSNQRLNLTE